MSKRDTNSVRLHRRVPVNAICLLRVPDHDAVNEPVVNISMSGMLMRSRLVLKAGTRCEAVVAFNELGTYHTERLYARVVRADGYFTALQFVNLLPDQRAYLRAVLDAHPIDMALTPAAS